MSEFPPLGHVAVTVQSCDASRPWYGELFGMEPVLDEDTGPFRHVVYAIGGTLLGLHAFPGGVREPGPFHPYRAGLDHVAFGVADRGELEKWQKTLDDLGVAHGGIVDAHYGSGLSFKDPDNIALEFFAPPA